MSHYQILGCVTETDGYQCQWYNNRDEAVTYFQTLSYNTSIFNIPRILSWSKFLTRLYVGYHIHSKIKIGKQS